MAMLRFKSHWVKGGVSKGWREEGRERKPERGGEKKRGREEGWGFSGGPAPWVWPTPPLWTGLGWGRERAGEGGTGERLGADGRLTVNKS